MPLLWHIVGANADFIALFKCIWQKKDKNVTFTHSFFMRKFKHRGSDKNVFGRNVRNDFYKSKDLQHSIGVPDDND